VALGSYRPELAMFIAFGIEGVGIYYLYLWGHDPF
jgi:OFA family oxalate/formate antiporter-like MFS transporter